MESRTFASDAMSFVTFGPGTSTRKSWMSPRPRSSSSITSLSLASAGTSAWKFRTASSIRALVSAVDMRCGILSPAMDYEHIRYEQDGPVTVITIDRPERMNAVAPRTADELRDAWTPLPRRRRRARRHPHRRRAGRVLRRRRPQGRLGGRPRHRDRATASSARPAGPTWPSRRSPPSTASPTPAGWSGRAGPTCASPTTTRRSASPAGAGTSAWATAAPSACRGSSATAWPWT